MYAVHGKRYEVGCILTVIYQASGGAIDWAQTKEDAGGLGVENSVSMELRPRSGSGFEGFSPPPSEIIPTGEEIWAFHKSMAEQILADLP